MKLTNDHKKLAEKVMKELPLYRENMRDGVPEEENFHIDQVLYRGDPRDPEDIMALAVRDDTFIMFSPLTPEKTPYNYPPMFGPEICTYDDLLFGPLEDGYDISFIQTDVHESIWADVGEDMARDNIQYPGGVQKYIAYCKENGITQAMLREKHGYTGIDITERKGEMQMVTAIITNQDKGSLKLELPMDKYKMACALDSIGIHKSSISSGADRNGISVQYTAGNDLGRHLLALFPEEVSLDDANKAADMVENAHPAVREDLEQYLLYDQIRCMEDLPKEINQMLIAASAAHETYYFPLTGKLWDDEYGEELKAGQRRIAANEDIIRERFQQYLDRDNMAAYYNDAGADKLLLADWGFEAVGEELYGTVSVYLTEPMTEEEESALREWISGQNSDGLGEGFEQQAIELDEYELYVSFWDSGKGYYIKNEAEMEDYLGISGQQMGGM